MIEKGEKNTEKTQCTTNTKHTQEDIKQILITSFYDILELICKDCKNVNIKKEFELEDQYIKDFESIDNLVQNKNISQKTKKIIFYVFRERFKIFPLRASSLKNLDDISEEEKIQKLDDMYQKLELWIKFYTPNKETYNKIHLKLLILSLTTKNEIIKNYINTFLTEILITINNSGNYTNDEIEDIKKDFYKHIKYAENSTFSKEKFLDLLEIFLEFLEANKLNSDATFIRKKIEEVKNKRRYR